MVIMRTLFFIAMLIGSFAGFAQSKQIDKIRISSAKVVKAVNVSDIIPDELGKCKVTSYHFYANLGNSVKSMDAKDGGIAQAMRTVVAELKAGDKFVIENIRYDCKDDHKKSYVFIIQ